MWPVRPRVQQRVHTQISSQSAVIPVWKPVSVTVDLSSVLVIVIPTNQCGCFYEGAYFLGR